MANWRYRMLFKDLFVDDPFDLSESEISELANKMAGRIDSFINKLSKNNKLRYEMDGISSELRTCSTVQDIDDTIDRMYDICDDYSVWVE
jgi:hypothetical protein